MAVAVAVIGVGASMRIDDGRLRKADGFNSNDSISVAGDLLYFSFCIKKKTLNGIFCTIKTFYFFTFFFFFFF